MYSSVFVGLNTHHGLGAVTPNTGDADSSITVAFLNSLADTDTTDFFLTNFIIPHLDCSLLQRYVLWKRWRMQVLPVVPVSRACGIRLGLVVVPSLKELDSFWEQ